MYKILIVDDSPKWRFVNQKIIESIFGDDADITLADCGKVALNIAFENKEEPFDIVLSDMQMEEDFYPEYAGEWFVRELKMLDNYQNTYIIMISASSDIGDIAQKLNVDFIPKRELIHDLQKVYYKLEEKGFVQA